MRLQLGRVLLTAAGAGLVFSVVDAGQRDVTEMHVARFSVVDRLHILGCHAQTRLGVSRVTQHAEQPSPSPCDVVFFRRHGGAMGKVSELLAHDRVFAACEIP